MSDTNTDDKATDLSLPDAVRVRLKAPEGCTSISIRGMAFDVPESGMVDAPLDVAAELRSHGFTDPAPAPRRGRAALAS